MILIRPNICALLMVCSGIASSPDSAQKFEKNEVLQRALLLEAVKVHKLSVQVWENDFYDLWEVVSINYPDFVLPLAPQHEKDSPARRFLLYG